VQTFLPYEDFDRSSAVLDPARLGKQRVESLQILRALTLPEYGWANHPAVRMWQGRTEALVLYGLACVREWTGRGYADSTSSSIAEFAPDVASMTQSALDTRSLLPSWLGDERLHASHRSALLRKDAEWYRRWFGPAEPDDLPYFWPDGDPPRPASPGAGRCRTWVVRPARVDILGRFVDEGVVALGDSSGLAVDVGAMDGAAMRRALRELQPARRPGKQLRQLETFVRDVRIGDEVAVPIESGKGLLLGRVTGDYTFVADPPTCHRRRVRWEGRLDRSQVDPPASLQDPRTLFRVDVRP
jgi:Pyrimidine dimer DNA glycosylase